VSNTSRAYGGNRRSSIGSNGETYNRLIMKNTFALRASDLRALAQLATDGTLGVTDLVEAMHAGIVKPMGLAHPTKPARTTRITGFVYGAVRGTTRVVGGALDLALSLPPKNIRPSSIERDALISALNGVIGDRLAKTNNELAINMQFCVDGDAISISPEALAPIARRSRKVVILVHGLCMNNRQWLRDGHDHGAALAKDLGFTPIYLRYNSGRHVSDNGREFAQQLEALVAAWPNAIDEIAIVAHSMGGLVTRSAFELGKTAKHAWMPHVKRVVFLGTPHQGAPLERGGHWIDVILGAAPFAKPLARIGKVRSVGITDLRHGRIHNASNQTEDAFTKPPPGTKFFAIAATTSKSDIDWRSQVIGDGLVPVKSALAIVDDTSAFPSSRRWVAHETNHMQLLSAPHVYSKLKAWLA
jgi:pimeloyl-ACP methyl ester carboxylesterase